MSLFRVLFSVFVGGCLFHSVLEGTDTLAGTTHEFWDFLSAKKEKDDKENNDNLRHAETEE